MPAFVLILMFGAFPDGRMALESFTDRAGCDEAASAIIKTFGDVSYAGCYDTRLGIVTNRRYRN